jgi:hypothetical protein
MSAQRDCIPTNLITELLVHTLQMLLDTEIFEILENLGNVKSNSRHKFELWNRVRQINYRKFRRNGHQP